MYKLVWKTMFSLIFSSKNLTKKSHGDLQSIKCFSTGSSWNKNCNITGNITDTSVESTSSEKSLALSSLVSVFCAEMGSGGYIVGFSSTRS